jgi:hypothetical protein
LKPSLPCIENEVENGLALETYYSWSGSGLETSTANTSSAEPITQEIPGPASFTPAEIDPLLLAETEAMLQHIQEPLKLQNKDSKMTNESPDYDSYSEVSGKSSEEEYTVEKLLAVWKERRNKHYLVKWATGGVSWQPEENIDQSLISDFGGYAGFKEGVKVVSFQRRKGKPMYRLQFLDYVGAEKDKYWWVPESTVHPDLRKTDRRGKPSRRA